MMLRSSSVQHFTIMNKYLVCFSVLAFSFCFIEAVTRKELDILIYQVNSYVRVQENIFLQSSSRDALLTATTPEQRICVASKMGPAFRDLNIGLNTARLQEQQYFGNLTDEEVANLNAEDLYQQLYERNMAASTAQSFIEQINQC